MNRNFRSAIASVLIVTSVPTLGLSTAGCSSWISNFKKDPVGQIQNVIQIVETIISVGTLVFGQVKQALPTDAQAKAQADWDEALLKVNSAVAALQSAVKVAADANQPNPDLSKLVTDLMAAIDALHAVVNTYSAKPSTGKLTAAVKPKGYDLFVQQIALLKSQSPMISSSTK